jgi:hypothetical protein
MVIGVVLTMSIAVGVVYPRIQGALNSPAMLGVAAFGDVLTKGMDYVMAGGDLTYGGSNGDLFTTSNVHNNPYTAELLNVLAGNGPTVTTNQETGTQIISYPPTATPATPQEAAAQQLFQTVNAATDNGVVPVAPAVDAVPSTGAVQYQVRPGDTMSAISARLLGSSKYYPGLCALNAALVGPNCILRVGQMLTISKSDLPATGGQQYVAPPRQLASPVQSAAIPTRAASTETQEILMLVYPTPTPLLGQAYIDKFLAEQKANASGNTLDQQDRDAINAGIAAMQGNGQ